MNCLHCNAPIPDGYQICRFCTTRVGETEPRKSKKKPDDVPAPESSVTAPDDSAREPFTSNRFNTIPRPAGFTCSKCYGDKVQVQAVAETEKRGCVTAGLYALLIAVPFVGWAFLIMLLFGQESKTVSYCVCQSCGNRWKLD